MIQLKQVIGAWLLASVLLPTAAAHTATYYVATTGSDSNPGTKNQPVRTVAYAVSMMVAGDTTYVMAGTYNEGTIWIKRSGTQVAPIRLLNYPGHAPKIVFIDPEAGHRIYIQHLSGEKFAMGWITIEGLELTNGHDGIKWHNLHDSTIRRNWIHDNKYMGMLGVGGARILIDQNTINHNGDFATCLPGNCPNGIRHHGIYSHGSTHTITNNLFYDNLAWGIQQTGSAGAAYDTAKHPSTEFAGAANWMIAHNTFAYSANRGGIVVWGSLCTNTRIENNIFYENSVRFSAAPQGIEFVAAGSARGIQIRNNLAFASGSGGTAFIGPTGAKEWINYTQSGNVVNVSNPGFVYAPATLPDSPNFALTARSPAIDAGLPVAETRIAFDGTPRPQGHAPDIGAYEYVAGSDAQSPSAPMALQVH